MGTYFSLPDGDGYQVDPPATGTDDDPYHFATLDQDTTANDHAQFREYSNMAGRWERWGNCNQDTAEMAISAVS